MASAVVADHLLQRLPDWGAEHVLAFPGDGISGVLAAWERAENKPRFVQSRHEEMSAFEAVGYSRLTGWFGVYMATSGPGPAHPVRCPLRRRRPTGTVAHHVRADEGCRHGDPQRRFRRVGCGGGTDQKPRSRNPAPERNLGR